jgi:peroxiredoxin
MLKDTNGNNRNAGDFIGQGKWTVVAVWASDCAICNEEIHHMVSFHEAHRNRDAGVLGVSIDGQDRQKQAQAFIREHALNFPNLIAELPQMGAFGAGPVMGTPTFYIYSPAGKLLAHQTGPVSREQLEAYIAKSRHKTGKGGG